MYHIWIEATEIVVESNKGVESRFSLTAEGAAQAGRMLFDSNQNEWTLGSCMFKRRASLGGNSAADLIAEGFRQSELEMSSFVASW